MGVIFDIKRFAVHDGPGIRTTVFMKGCPLSCAWCHNPESMDPNICTIPKIVKIGNKSFNDEETVGRDMTVDELMIELKKEKVFMEESGGGVTFSGGEPLLQHEFLNETLKACKNEGMHTIVDTSGYARWEILEETAGLTDLFLFDLKIMNDTLHQQYTGVSNIIILENLAKLLTKCKKVRVRLPMVPEVSFNESNIQATLNFLVGLPHPPEGIDLLPYHNTASHKYERFKLKNSFPGMETLPKNKLEKTKKRFEEAGFDVKIGG